jgi:hypothetical protein
MAGPAYEMVMMRVATKAVAELASVVTERVDEVVLPK